MTFDISKYPEPEDYGEVLLRLMASPHRKSPPRFPGAESLAGPESLSVLMIVGRSEGQLAGSLYEREILSLTRQTPDLGLSLDFDMDKKNADFIRSLIQLRKIEAVEIIAEGGIVCAAADMAQSASSDLYLDTDSFMDDENLQKVGLFAEDQSRYLISTSEPEFIEKLSRDARVETTYFGNFFDQTVDWSTRVKTIDTPELIVHHYRKIGRMNFPFQKIQDAKSDLSSNQSG